MKLSALQSILRTHPDARPDFLLPDGEPIPMHFHLTEVGHVAKNFIDCGGTIRRSEACILQLWTNEDDADHRLTAGKFAKILELGQRVLPGKDLEVEVEWDCCVTSQYPIATVQATPERIEFQLTTKHTDCLAREKCGVKDDSCGCAPARLETAAACC
jgi:hypothetical protein